MTTMLERMEEAMRADWNLPHGTYETAVRAVLDAMPAVPETE